MLFTSRRERTSKLARIDLSGSSPLLSMSRQPCSAPFLFKNAARIRLIAFAHNFLPHSCRDVGHVRDEDVSRMAGRLLDS